MLDVARLGEKDRADLFRATAQKMGVDAAIVEKDFWVCWTLDYLFQGSPWKDDLAFKGGTSLSKSYNVIGRFSEDIDLILDWGLLGYAAEEPWAERSNKKQDAFGKEAVARTREFIRRKALPVIESALSERVKASVRSTAENDNLIFHYPKAFSLDAVLPQIKLEFGPMAEFIPNEMRAIRPYAADQFPNVFRQAETTVRTVAAERTFWEKATILHQEAHRPAGHVFPPRYSRHYYDLYRLGESPFRKTAIQQIDLLGAVVKFKRKFYHSAWAKFEEAKPGTSKLLPSKDHRKELQKDYKAMEAMLFDEAPALEQVLESLKDLEAEINHALQWGTFSIKQQTSANQWRENVTLADIIDSLTC